MRTSTPHIPVSRSIKSRLFGSKLRTHKISIPDSAVEFFEDIPTYRSTKTRKLEPKLGKVHRSRRSKPRNPSTQK